MAQLRFLTTLFFLFSHSIVFSQSFEIRSDLQRFIEKEKFAGSISMYDLKHNKLIFSNPGQFHQRFIPASTFKIFNSLVALETGIAADENFLLQWDGVQRQIAGWNRDQTMKTAFKVSAVWYYQELARRIGGARMKLWLDRCRYGNADTTGGIDRFWLSGGLRISPEEQINFLVSLYKNALPFSRRTMDIVKAIMIAEDSKPEFTIHAKTGMADTDSSAIGWYVGYVEVKENVIFFVTCLQTSDKTSERLIPSRKEITINVLKELGYFSTK